MTSDRSIMKQRILVVDDEVAVRNLVSEILRRQGFDVIEADCALEAILAVRQSGVPVDLVISDVQMPSINGIELAGMLQAERPTCRVLLMSGTMLEDSALPYPFLRKPFASFALAERVKHVLHWSNGCGSSIGGGRTGDHGDEDFPQLS